MKSSTDSGGQITRVRDVGRVELGAQTYGQFFKMDGKPAGGIAIYQLPEANALDTAKGVRAAMAALRQELSRRACATRFRSTRPCS